MIPFPSATFRPHALEDLLRDLAFAARILVRKPRFCLVIIATLGLGIGLTTSMFSLVSAVLLAPLPYPAPGRLVEVMQDCKFPGSSWTLLDFLEPREILACEKENKECAGVAAYISNEKTLAGGGEPQSVKCGEISASFFQVFGARLALGRGFRPEEDRPGGPAVAILSYGLWQGRFGGAADIVGHSISLDQKSYTVIGVLGRSFRFRERYDVLVPLALPHRKFTVAHVTARLRPGVSLKQAQVVLNGIYQRVLRPAPGGGGQVQLKPLDEVLVGNVRQSLLAVLAAGGFILLIACVNAGNMLWARGVERSKEMAVRLSLGAGRLRLIRQLLTESLLLSALGTGLGLLLAYATLALLRPLTAGLPAITPIGLDHRVLGFAVLLTLVVAVLFGLAPAWLASRVELNDALKPGGYGGGATRPKQRLLGRLTVVGEVALALMLVLGAGLFAKTFLHLRHVHLGFNPDHILTVTIKLDKKRYPDAASQVAYFQRAIARLRALPSVESVGAGNSTPFQPHCDQQGVGIRLSNGGAVWFKCGDVSEDYFHTLGIPLKRGRWFGKEDPTGKRIPLEAVASESFVRAHFPGEDPIGKRFYFSVIIGVVGDVHLWAGTPPQPRLFWLYRQQMFLGGVSSMTLDIKTQGDPMKLAPSVRGVLWNLDRSQPTGEITTLSHQIAASLGPQRLNALLSGGLALLGLVLALLGIYGVVSFAVIQRTHEIGVRMALGAQRGNVIRLVLGEGLVLAIAGSFFGLYGAYLAGGLISRVWNVGSVDPLAMARGTLLLVLAVMAASYLPARAASSVDPTIALRSE